MKATRALLAVALILAAGACGDDAGESARKAVTGAAGALRDAKTATVHFDVKLLSPNLTDVAQWAGTSKVKYGDPDVSDTEYSRASVVVPTLQPRPGQPLSSTYDIDLREISIGPVRYQKSSKLRLAAGKSWVKLPEGSYVHYGTDKANPDLVVIDPQRYLKMLANLSTGLAYSGDTGKTETVDGAQTRVYRIDCTLGRSGGCDTGPLPAVFVSTFSGTDSRLSLTLWLDTDGRLRKLAVDGDLDAGPNSVTGEQKTIYKLTATMTLTDFGKPVEVAEPPADQTTTEHELAL